ncbi:MAG: hypothetical protein LBP62_04055 [Clostridiales bacterium]|jgi:hypothetical protein|nr:hypothetical protein [Clostridiales bacterium]
MAVMVKNTIQALASEAKNRLKRGYWNDVKERRKEECAGRVKRADNELTAEEKFYYGKVKKILAESENAVIINPIGLLMDKKYYAGLDACEKQLYVFKLSAIYISVKRKIQKGAEAAAANG